MISSVKPPKNTKKSKQKTLKNTTPDITCDRHSRPHQKYAWIGNKGTSSMHAPPPNRSRLDVLEEQLCHQQLAAQLQCAQWAQHGEQCLACHHGARVCKSQRSRMRVDGMPKFVNNKGTIWLPWGRFKSFFLARQGRERCKKQKVVESGVFCVFGKQPLNAMPSLSARAGCWCVIFGTYAYYWVIKRYKE